MATKGEYETMVKACADVYNQDKRQSLRAMAEPLVGIYPDKTLGEVVNDILNASGTWPTVRCA